jgi:hypothetical protein
MPWIVLEPLYMPGSRGLLQVGLPNITSLVSLGFISYPECD